MARDIGFDTTLMPPRAVRHASTLLWWLALALPIAGAMLAAQAPRATGVPPATLVARGEPEAFVGLLFGKVDARDHGALQPAVLRRQLERLREAGAHSVGLADVAAFLRGERELPERPVLLSFAEARRRTLEAIDPVLAELSLRATAFVDTEAVARGSVEMAARRHLRELAASGRWEFALKSCGQRDSAWEVRAATALATWTGVPVVAAGCPGEESAGVRSTLPLHFRHQGAGANYRDDAPHALRLVLHPPGATTADALVSVLERYLPRRQALAADFDGDSLPRGWSFDRAHARLGGGVLRLEAAARDPNATLTPGGTERWTDASASIEVQSPVSGELWIYARRAGSRSFVRFGLVGDTALLQVADGAGPLRQLAAQPAPHGVLRLTLTTLGERALAQIDGQSVTARPAPLPARVARGAYGIAAWNAQGPARAELRSARFEPLPRRAVVVEAHAGDEVLARLQAQAGSLWAVSPRLYRWRGHDGQALDAMPRALDIFLHRQRFAVLPAVLVERWPRDDRWEAFARELQAWTASPQVDGLNLVTTSAPDPRRLEQLRRRLAAEGKTLLLTTLPRNTALETALSAQWLDPAPEHGAGTLDDRG